LGITFQKLKTESKNKMNPNTKVAFPIPRKTNSFIPFNLQPGFVYHPTTNNLQVIPAGLTQTKQTKPKQTKPKQAKPKQQTKSKQIGFTTSPKQAELIQSNLQVLTCPKNDNINNFFTFEKRSFEYILLHKTHNISHIISSYEKCVLKQDIGPFLKSGDNIPYIWIDGTFQKMSLFTSDPRKNITPPLYCVALDINVSNRTDEFYGGQKCLFANIRPESQEIEATKEEEDGSETEDEVEPNPQDEEKKTKHGMTSWMVYKLKVWYRVREENPKLSVPDCWRYIAELWKKLSDEEKAKYKKEAFLMNEKKRKETETNSSVAKKRRISLN